MGVVLLCSLFTACASGGGSASREPDVRPKGGDYLHLVAVRDGYNDTYVLHWMG